MKSQIHKLSLVYPPLSNQAAEWVKNDQEVQDILKGSNLYIIGQRAEIYFSFNENLLKQRIYQDRCIEGYISSDTISSKFVIDLIPLFEEYSDLIEHIEEVEIAVGDKIIKVLYDGELLLYYTVEKMLFDRSRQDSLILELDDYRDFNKYILHYVGISKSDDSLTRLVIKPHDKRLRILSNEDTFRTGSRLTDEITFFFFKISTIELKMADPENIDVFLDDFGKITGLYVERIADAEKALINILDTKYNTVQYRSYPKSSDGLYNYNLSQIAYFIGESYCFYTDSCEINGNYTEYDVDPEDKAGFIGVDKDSVTLYKLT